VRFTNICPSTRSHWSGKETSCVYDTKSEDTSPVVVVPVSLKRNREQCKALAKRICVILNEAESEVQ
jgi:hypothetical protein